MLLTSYNALRALLYQSRWNKQINEMRSMLRSMRTNEQQKTKCNTQIER